MGGGVSFIFVVLFSNIQTFLREVSPLRTCMNKREGPKRAILCECNKWVVIIHFICQIFPIFQIFDVGYH